MSIKTVLVSQPEPEGNSPYFELKKDFGLDISFRSFIYVDGVTSKEIRVQKIYLNKYTAVIFTSRNAINYYFEMAEKSRYKVPETMKYFCTSEAVAYYLQRYIVYRKRRIYVGGRTFSDLIPHIKEHSKDRFLLPSADILNKNVSTLLDKTKVEWSRMVLYKTKFSDLSDLENVFYDILVFFSPLDLESLFINFPDFKQNDTIIAAFGKTTEKKAKELGLKVNIKAPMPKTPSMTMAISKYIKNER